MMTEPGEWYRHLRAIVFCAVWSFTWGFTYHIALMLVWSWSLVQEQGMLSAALQLWSTKEFPWFWENVLDGIYFALLCGVPSFIASPRLAGAKGLLLGTILLGIHSTIKSVQWGEMLSPAEIGLLGLTVTAFASALFPMRRGALCYFILIPVAFVFGLAISHNRLCNLDLPKDSRPPLDARQGVPLVFAVIACCPPFVRPIREAI